MTQQSFIQEAFFLNRAWSFKSLVTLNTFLQPLFLIQSGSLPVGI